MYLFTPEEERLKLWAELDDINFTGYTQKHWDSLACTRDESPFAIGDKLIPKFKGLINIFNARYSWPVTVVAIKEVPGYTYGGEAFIYTNENGATGFYINCLKKIIDVSWVDEVIENLKEYSTCSDSVPVIDFNCATV